MNKTRMKLWRYRLILPLLLVILLTACSGGNYSSTPGRYSEPEENYPDPKNKTAWSNRFPGDQYIIAWGVSNKNSQLAEQNAKTQVAAAVQSTIESELISVMESETTNAINSEYQKLHLHTKVTSNFNHAELIRIVQPTAHHQDNEFRVLAVLSRAEAARELMIPYNEQAADFRLFATELDSFQADYPRFTKTWNKLKLQHGKMLEPAAEVRAVTGYQPLQIRQDEERWQLAQASRIKILSDAVVVVNFANHPNLNNEVLAGKIHAALATLGLSSASGECTRGTVGLKAVPELQWHHIMGRVAELTLLCEVGLCEKQNSSFNFEISGREMRGEGRQPLKDLMENLQPSFLAREIRNNLKYILPL